MANMTFKTNLLPNSTTLEYSLGSENQPWNICGELNGNASSTDKLKTARNINGTAFDGTANITTANWGTARNISISDSDASNTGTAVSVNGSAAVTLKLPATIKATLKGNADTATKATQDQNGLRIDTGYLKLSGGIMTGNITMRTNTSMSTGTAPSTNTNFNRIQWEDKDGYSTGGLGNRWYTDGTEAMEIYEAKRKTDGAFIFNQMALGFKSDDTPYVWLGQPATWRTALGLGARATDSTAYLPLAGGTMTGNLRIKNAGPYIDCTAVTRGTAYNGNYYRTAPEWIDSAGKRLAQIEYHKSSTNSDLFLYVLGDHTSSDQYSGIVINKLLGNTGSANIRVDANAGKLYGAVWNDYAEFRQSKITEPGRCIKETGNGDLILSEERLEKGCEIISDTYGFAIGQSKKYNTPTACTGRVLAYPYESIEEFKKNIGQGVCSGPNGTVSIMTDEECRNWPQCIIGTISEIPNYDIWYAGGENEGNTPIKVNGRIWIRVR